MGKLKRKIIEKILKVMYRDTSIIWFDTIYSRPIEIVWFDDLVEMDFGEYNKSEYHRIGHLKECWTKTMTRREAEKLGGKPCKYCFVHIYPKYKIRKNRKCNSQIKKKSL